MAEWMRYHFLGHRKIEISFAHFHEANSHVVKCPIERPTGQGTKRDLWPTHKKLRFLI